MTGRASQGSIIALAPARKSPAFGSRSPPFRLRAAAMSALASSRSGLSDIGWQTQDRQGHGLRPRHQGVNLQVLVGRVRVATDGTAPAQRRAANTRGEARVGASARELALHPQTGIAGGCLVALEQRVGFGRGRYGQELALDREFRGRARDRGGVDDLLHSRQHLLALLSFDVAQVDLAFCGGRRGVDGLAPLHEADVNRDAALQIGQLVESHDLVRQLADGADALLEVAPRVSGPAGDLEDEEYAALA